MLANNAVFLWIETCWTSPEVLSVKPGTYGEVHHDFSAGSIRWITGTTGTGVGLLERIVRLFRWEGNRVLERSSV